VYGLQSDGRIPAPPHPGRTVGRDWKISSKIAVELFTAGWINRIVADKFKLEGVRPAIT
jgi:hypothetical protein